MNETFDCIIDFLVQLTSSAALHYSNWALQTFLFILIRFQIKFVEINCQSSTTDSKVMKGPRYVKVNIGNKFSLFRSSSYQLLRTYILDFKKWITIFIFIIVLEIHSIFNDHVLFFVIFQR